MGNNCSKDAVKIREVRSLVVTTSRFQCLPPVPKFPVRIRKSTFWIPEVVEDVLREISSDEAVNHEYIPVPGLPEFTSAATRMVFGDNCSAVRDNKIGCFQSIGETGAVRLGADFLHRQLRMNTVMLPRASEGLYHDVFKAAAFSEVLYYNNKSPGENDFFETLKSFPVGSVAVFKADTLSDALITTGALQKIVDTIQVRKLFPLVLAGGLGLVSGSVERDAGVIRSLAGGGVEMFVAVSLSRQFGLGDDSVGCLFVVTSDKSSWLAVCSHLIYMAVPMWGNPPQHGALVVERILNDTNKRQRWEKELQDLVQRDESGKRDDTWHSNRPEVA
ncbi:aspartate aminotransferase, cytoplasmic-like [Branchiostoma floridae x Branchiostoma belcheri]